MADRCYHWKKSWRGDVNDQAACPVRRLMPVAYQPGQRVLHPEFGEGVVVRIAGNGVGE